MTTKYTDQEVVDFFHDVFNPTGEDLIDSNAFGLMSQYLIQIEQALESRSMTQKELADKIGTSASYISQFFNLNKLINFKTLAKIELALDINFELKKPTASGLNHINKIEKFYNKPNQTISNVNFIASNDELFAA